MSIKQTLSKVRKSVGIDKLCECLNKRQREKSFSQVPIPEKIYVFNVKPEEIAGVFFTFNQEKGFLQTEFLFNDGRKTSLSEYESKQLYDRLKDAPSGLFNESAADFLKDKLNGSNQ